MIIYEFNKGEAKKIYEINQIIKNIYSEYIIQGDGTVIGVPINKLWDRSFFVVEDHIPEIFYDKIIISKNFYESFKNGIPISIEIDNNKLIIINKKMEKFNISRNSDDGTIIRYLKKFNKIKSIYKSRNEREINVQDIVPHNIVEDIINRKHVVIEISSKYKDYKIHATQELSPIIKKLNDFRIEICDDKLSEIFNSIFTLRNENLRFTVSYDFVNY